MVYLRCTEGRDREECECELVMTNSTVNQRE